MIDIFMPLQAFLKNEKICIDNNVFRLHYRFTVPLLLLFALLVSCKQFFGEPIQCIDSDENKHKEFVNSFCWMHGTYTINSSLYQKQAIYPGIAPQTSKDTKIFNHTYYQWIVVVLLLQSALFYVPRYIWKTWEGGRLKALVSDLTSPVMPKEWNKKRKSDLITYLGRTNIYTHNLYAFKYAFCEFLNCANVIAQIMLLDLFLVGSFSNYTFLLSVFNQRTGNEMNDQYYTLYFPKQTKCQYKYYGPSGDAQHRDVLCILSLNIINEKVFVIMWVWFMFLAFISSISLLYRVLIYMLPPFRTLLIMGQLRFIPKGHISKVVNKFHIGDWFILYHLGKNLNPIVYKELIIELSNELNVKPVVV